MDELRDQPSKQPSFRARRIRDEDWEPYRPLIEKLYREQGSSRSMLIEKLGHEGLIVTEKQVKHILMKWGIKKKISSADMAFMLVTKRQRDADSKATRFTCHGQDVKEEKLQRASKRLKIPTSHPVAMPSYIEVLSPEPSMRSPTLDQASAMLRFDNISDGSFPPGLPHMSTLRSSPFRSTPPFTREEGFIFEPGDADLGLMPFQIDEEAPWNSYCTPAAPYENVSFQITPEISTSILDSHLVDQRFREVSPASIEYSIIDMAQDIFMPSASTTFNRAELRTALPPPVPDSIIPSHLSTPLTFSDPASSHNRRQRSIDDSLRATISPKQVLFYGSSPEHVISSLQMMKTLIQGLQDEIFWSSHVLSGGSSQRKLLDEIRSEVFMSDIDDVTIWAHQNSIRFIEQQRTARRRSNANTRLPSWHHKDHDQGSNCQDGSILQKTDISKLAGAVTSYCYIPKFCTAGGTVRIQLRQIPKATLNDDSNMSYCIDITAIPEVRSRNEAGIHIFLPKHSHAFPIYTTIRTFNVVPEDSEVIRCVTMNDLVGFRRLIGEGEACPRDVNPGGTSLLYYAIFSGCSEIFRFLLENGASTDDCDVYANSVHLIDTIWMYYMEDVIYSESRSRFDLIKRIDQCRSMTEIARANGCYAEESVLYNEELLSPLFDISYIHTLKTTARQCADTVKQLLAVGYDKERRNINGQTPLLLAAFSTCFRSLTGLKSLLAEKTNIHAIENHGRSALHLCLDFSEGLSAICGYLSICRCSTWALREQSFDGDIAITGNFSDSNDEEETYSNNTSSEKESQISFARGDNDDCLRTTDDAAEWHECCYDEYTDFDDEDAAALFYYCEYKDIDDFSMPAVTLDNEESPDTEPEPGMNKARLRLKLLALLQAGCDPNIRDIEGESPSDYARVEELWPQWAWALEKTGWEYNEDTDLCEKKQLP